MPNINWNEGAAMIETSRVPYYQLLNVENYADVKTAFEPDHADHEKWNGIMSSRFHNMIQRWPEWFWEYQRKDYEMLKHGVGPIMFEDYPNWRFRALDAGALKVPKGTISCVSKRMPYCAVFTAERVHSLWEKIKDSDSAEKAGWNVRNVRDAIMYAMKGGTGTLQAWDYYERILNSNDLSASFSDGDIIWCVTLLVQEFSGKISRLIITEAAFNNPVDQTPSATNEGFLFSDIGKHDAYGQCLVAFFQEIGDGTWHSVRGLGAKAFKHLTISNQLKCRMLASAEMTSGLTLQLTDTRSKDAAQLIQRGMVTLIQPGAKYIQVQQAGYLDGPITIDRILGNHLANNLGQFSPRNISRDDGKGEMPTATQVNQQVAREASLSQGQIALHYTTLDAMFSEMFRRAATKGTSDEEAKRFQKECKDAGVPPEALRDICYVRANRLSGYGSAQMRQLSDEQMLPVLSMLPEEGKNNFLRDHVGGIKGADKIERYVPQQHIADEDDSIAAMENAMVAMGRMPVMASGQNDVIHAQSHLDDATATLEPVAQAIEAGQNDPQALQSAFQYLELMGPHLEQHIGRLSGDPFRRKEAKLFQDQLNAMVAFNGKLRSAIRTAQREQSIAAQQEERATALGALDRAKIQSAQVDNALKAQKTQSDIARKDAKTANDLRLKTISTLNKMGLDKAKTVSSVKVSAVNELNGSN